jgi:hypothetical protein
LSTVEEPNSHNPSYKPHHTEGIEHGIELGIEGIRGGKK